MIELTFEELQDRAESVPGEIQEKIAALPDRERCRFVLDDAGEVFGYREPLMFEGKTPVKWSAVLSIETGKLVISPGKLVPPEEEEEEEEETGGVVMIETGRIEKGGQQPRTIFDEERIVELRGSMKARGFDAAFPLIVRRVEEEEERFELADGERRWRAAQAEGIMRVPCIVREMTDLEMLELALTAGVQHEDLQPMEEALGYLRLLAFRDEHGEPVHTVGTIAARIGRGWSQVSRRIRIARLHGSPVGHALREGKIHVTHAEILARVPSAAMREELLERVLRPTHGRAAPLPVAELETLIKLDYVKELRGLTFDPENAELVPVQTDEHGERCAGGRCSECPLSSRNATDGQRTNKTHLCMNTECFRAKEAAAHDQWQAGVTGENVRRLSREENAVLWDHTGTSLAVHSPYVELSDQPSSGELKPGTQEAPRWKKLVARGAVPVVLARDGAGKERELVERSLVLEAAREAEKTKPEGERIFREAAAREPEKRPDDRVEAAARDVAQEQDQAAAQAEEERENRVGRAQFEALYAAARRTLAKQPEGFLTLMVEALICGAERAEVAYDICDRREWDDYGDDEHAVPYMLKKAKGMEEPFRNELTLELLVNLHALYVGPDEALKRWAKLYEVNLKAVRKETLAAMEEEERRDAERAEIAGALDSVDLSGLGAAAWDGNGLAEAPVKVGVALPKGVKPKASLLLVLGGKGWHAGWQVVESRGSLLMAERPCRNSAHYDTPELAMRAGLLGIQQSASEIFSSGDAPAVKERLEAILQTLKEAAPPAKGRKRKG